MAVAALALSARRSCSACSVATVTASEQPDIAHRGAAGPQHLAAQAHAVMTVKLADALKVLRISTGSHALGRP